MLKHILLVVITHGIVLIIVVLFVLHDLRPATVSLLVFVPLDPPFLPVRSHQQTAVHIETLETVHIHIQYSECMVFSHLSGLCVLQKGEMGVVGSGCGVGWEWLLLVFGELVVVPVVHFILV